MGKRKIGCLIALATVILALVGCTALLVDCADHEPPPPYMVDRTEGWEPSFPAKVVNSVNLLDKQQNFESLRALLVPRPVEPLGPVEEEQVEECVRKALQETFGEAYLEPNGKNATVTESSSGQAWIYQDKSVLVAFDKETGEVWASIDVRLQPHITFLDDKTTFRYDCQLEELNREQLRWVGTAASGWQTEWNVDISDIELPLDAHSACEIGERTVYEFCRKQPATGGTVGGALYIYYCEPSDVYLVVNRYFIQALPREEGDPLFLWGYGSWKDRSRKAR